MKAPENIYGWKGSVLEIDLSTGKIAKRPLERSLREKYLGAYGLQGAY